MTQFWILSVALAGFAIFFFVWPWLQRSRLESLAAEQEHEERIRANVRIHKERLRELAAEKASGQLSDEQYAALKAELEEGLVADVEHSAESSSTRSDKFTLIALSAMAILSVVMTVALYMDWGAYNLVAERKATELNPEELQAARDMAAAGDTRGLLVQLRDKLRNAPSNTEGWSLLASSAMNAQLFDLAVEAYDRLVMIEQSPENKAALYGLKAQALYFQGNDIQSPQVVDAINSAFAIDKNEPNSLGLQAIANFESGEFASAIGYWQRILDTYPDHPSRESIQMGIRAATAELGENVSEPQELDNADSSSSLIFNLRIAEDVRANLDATKQLVVFARASNGPPMPLAVQRFPAMSAPEVVSLSDADAMMPALTLSAFQEVDLVVRITSGSVERDIGDYEVVLENIKWAEQSAPISIEMKADDLVSESL